MDRLLRARALLAEAQALGVSVEDLAAAAAGDALAAAASVPTVSQYIAQVSPTYSPGTLRTYQSYWRLAEADFGARPLNRVTVDDIDAVVVAAGERSRRDKPGSDGRAARENCVAALRSLFKRAWRAGLIPQNPAAEVAKPARLASRRRGLSDDELAEAIEAVRTTSRDLDLDLLLVRFHLESGARQEGALNLVLDDLDERRSTVSLDEKFGKRREQPISPSQFAAVEAHAPSRGASCGTDAVFRNRRCRPISRRHYDTLFANVQGPRSSGRPTCGRRGARTVGERRVRRKACGHLRRG